MPTVTYGGKQGASFQLEVDDNLVAVRTRSGRSFLAGPVPRREAALLEDMDLVAAFPEAGVEVYRQYDSAAPLDVVRRELRRSPDTRFAGHVLVEPRSGEPIIYTENLFVKFHDDNDREHCLDILREAGLAVKEELKYSTNAFFVAAPEGTGQQVFEIAQALLAREDVELCHPELVQRMQKKNIAPQQWHLKQTVINGQTINAHANVEAAQALTQGESVTIAIIDDGFDLDHQEFSTAGKVVAPRDFYPSSIDSNPRPGPGDDHGTACAGVACADGRFGASGVAPKARLMPIRMPETIGSKRIASAFEWAADHGADVISCSWGPPDGRWWNPNDPTHDAVFPLPDMIRTAIDYAATQGRAGRGCIICFAAGNGNESVDNDGYASYEKVLPIAACNDRGRRSAYSDFGRAVFCAFPSNDMAFPEEGRPEPLTPGIWTTDRAGRDGYNSGFVGDGDADGNYTNSFGGTSSATPGAAGVAALVIARNPSLRADEVKDILRRSCDRIDPSDGNYNETTGKSSLYGFGRLNAETAVRLAAPTTPVDGVVISRTYSEPIRDFQTTRVTLECGETLTLGNLKVQVDVEHSYIGDLLVTLIPPPGMNAAQVVLHNRTGGNAQNIKRTFDTLNVPALAALIGKSPRGTWTLEVRDEAVADVGTINRFGLELVFGAPVRTVAETPAPAAGPRRTARPTARRSQRTTNV